MKLKPMPQRIEVDDYHEFKAVKRLVRQIDSSIKVKEIGFAEFYLGIMYRGKLTNSKNRRMIRAIRAESLEFNGENY